METNTVQINAPVPECGFQRGTWECRGDGYLWDADHDGWDPAENDSPCPYCNTLEYLQRAKNEAESCSHYSNNGSSGTGEDIWLNCLSWAEAANPKGLPEILRQIGPVEALIDDPSAPEGYIVRTNNAEVTP